MAPTFNTKRANYFLNEKRKQLLLKGTLEQEFFLNYFDNYMSVTRFWVAPAAQDFATQIREFLH